MADHYEWAVAYQELLGLQLCWLAPKAKKPGYLGWPKSPIPAEHWREHPMHGMGCLHGLSGTATVDIDDVALAERALDACGLGLARLLSAGARSEGAPGRAKAWFQVPPELGLTRKTLTWRRPDKADVMVLELRGGQGFQDVLPPSVHPHGHRYRWLDAPRGGFPLAPDELLDLWVNWSAYADRLARASPWWKEPEKNVPDRRPFSAERSRRRDVSGSADVIGQFNAVYPITTVLGWYHYQPQGAKAWLRPQSETGIPGLKLMDNGRVYSHAGDALGDYCAKTGKAADSFDVYRLLEHGGDYRRAVRAAYLMLEGQ